MTDKLLRYLALVLVLQVPCKGQEGPSPDGKTKSATRAWLFPNDYTDSVTLGINMGEGLGFQPLAETKDGIVSARQPYEPLDMERVQLELRMGEQVLAVGELPLKAGRFYTFAAWHAEDKWQLKAFDDGPASTAAAKRPLRVFNFADGRRSIVTLGSQDTTVEPQSVVSLEASPNVTMVTAKVLAPDGSHPAVSSIEVDFASMPSAYVVVAPDYRGRMRPRIIEGGEVSTADQGGSSATAEMPGGQN
jgi:hypothetical protein